MNFCFELDSDCGTPFWFSLPSVPIRVLVSIFFKPVYESHRSLDWLHLFFLFLCNFLFFFFFCLIYFVVHGLIGLIGGTHWSLMGIFFLKKLQEFHFLGVLLNASELEYLDLVHWLIINTSLLILQCCIYLISCYLKPPFQGGSLLSIMLYVLSLVSNQSKHLSFLLLYDYIFVSVFIFFFLHR